ncbi:MAG: GHKL domain-containing protein [Candidatus Onthomonas sp.]
MTELQTTASILPNIPRLLTAGAEWAACLVLLLPQKKRFGKWPTALLLAIALAVQCFLQLGKPGSTQMAFSGVILWLLGLQMLPNILFMVLYFRVAGKLSWQNSAFLGCKAVMIAELLAAAAWMLYGIYFRTVQEDLRVELLCIGLTFALLLPLVYLLERRNKAAPGGSEVHWKQVLISVILALLTFTMSNIGYLEEDFLLDTDAQYKFFFIRALVDLCGCCIIYLVQTLYLEGVMKSELTAINNTLSQQYRQYLDFKEVSEYIGEQCHDLKHQIQEIRASYSDEEREAYLREMEQAVKTYQAWYVTGNSVLDSILTQKRLYCAKHDIELTCTADGKALEGLAARDICTIFGNLLDNAIEAVSGYEERENRVIHGEVCRKQSFLIIRIDNYFSGPDGLDDQIPETTKRDKTRHGYGLKSVRYVVEQYGGSLVLKAEHHWFIVKIMIPLGEGGPVKKGQATI